MDDCDIVKQGSSDEEQSLHSKVEESELVLEDLQQELSAVDSELTELVEQNQKYEILGNLCRSVEELESIGGADLLWKSEAGDVEEFLRDARERIHQFGESISDVEKRREAIVDRIGDQNHALDCLHYDLLEAMEREEIRRSEWVVEREPDEIAPRAMIMPWARNCEEDTRYRKSLSSSFATAIALGVLVGSIAIPVPDRPKELELPERMAKLVREQLPEPQPEPAPLLEPELEELIPEPELAEEIPPELAQDSAEAPAMAGGEKSDVKEQVKSRGILAFRESFASRSSLRPSARLGSQARVSNAGEEEVGRPQRAMVTTNAPGSSGGINLASISRDIGGGGPGMGGVAVSRVASSIGTGGDGSGGGGFGDRPMAGSALAGRTDEEIQIVFDKYKAALYRLYNRELRKDPTLRGQLVIKLTIEPDGSVSFCALQSSDMDAPVLAEQVVGRVRTFDFGAKEDIAAVTIIYPIDFLPAA